MQLWTWGCIYPLESVRWFFFFRYISKNGTAGSCGSFGLPRWLGSKESACQCRRCKRCRFDLWVGKILWRRKWQPTPAFLPGKIHGQRSLAGYRPWGHKESDMTERLCMHGGYSFLRNCHFLLFEAHSASVKWNYSLFYVQVLHFSASLPWFLLISNPQPHSHFHILVSYHCFSRTQLTLLRSPFL